MITYLTQGTLHAKDALLLIPLHRVKVYTQCIRFDSLTRFQYFDAPLGFCARYKYIYIYIVLLQNFVRPFYSPFSKRILFADIIRRYGKKQGFTSLMRMINNVKLFIGFPIRDCNRFINRFIRFYRIYANQSSENYLLPPLPQPPQNNSVFPCACQSFPPFYLVAPLPAAMYCPDSHNL